MGVRLVELCSHSGATDGCVMQGTELIDSTLSISDSEAEKIARKIGGLTSDYRAGGRLGQEIYLRFAGGTLLIVWNDVGGLMLRFRNNPDRVESIVAECRTFLKQVLDDSLPEIPATEAMSDGETWQRFEPQLINLLASVVSRSQTKRIIQRVLDSLEISGPVPDASLEEVTRHILDKVPDRRKREALAAEARDELTKAFNS